MGMSQNAYEKVVAELQRSKSHRFSEMEQFVVDGNRSTMRFLLRLLVSPGTESTVLERVQALGVRVRSLPDTAFVNMTLIDRALAACKRLPGNPGALPQIVGEVEAAVAAAERQR